MLANFHALEFKAPRFKSARIEINRLTSIFFRNIFFALAILDSSDTHFNVQQCSDEHY